MLPIIKKVNFILLTLSCVLIASIPNANGTRIKDITDIAGIRDNQLVGYGLVVGLDGTGDRTNQAPFTQQTFQNMLLQFGIRLPPNTNLQLKNIAAVSVSATLAPFSKPGQHLDVTIASLGNATSLRGGELLLTQLLGADGETYVIAQGSVIVSGFGALGGDGSKIMVNVTSSGRIPGGGIVEKGIDMPFVKNGEVTFELQDPDFTTSLKMQDEINKVFKFNIAKAKDAGTVVVKMKDLPKEQYEKVFYKDSPNEFKVESKIYDTTYDNLLKMKYVPIISQIQNIEMYPAEGKAKVIVNSRTGTIVVGQNVMISPVAVSHGNLSVVVSEHQFVSQPNAFAKGRTVVGTASDVNINQQNNHAFVFAPGASLNELVNAINGVGAAPGDIIAILEAVKSAGALHAELEVI